MTTTLSPERLRQIRLARGFSLEDVARRMDYLITEEALAHYETGASQPRPRIIARLAEAFEVKPELLQEPLALPSLCLTSIDAVFMARGAYTTFSVENTGRFAQSVQIAERLYKREEVAPSEAVLAQMQTAGRKASETARAELRAKGIAPVLWREGHVVEEDE